MALETFDFQTQKYWIWVCVAFCLFMFVALTAVGAAALALLDPPHPQPTLPAEIATSTLKKRKGRKGETPGAQRQTLGLGGHVPRSG